MSIRKMSEVWLYKWSPSEQVVLLALADFADDDGGTIFPSMDYLAWKTGYKKRNVQIIMGKLRDRSIALVVRESTAQRPAEYRLDFSRAELKKPFVKRGVQSLHG